MSDKKDKQRNSGNADRSKEAADQEHVADAHEQAEKDIEKDPDINLKPGRGDDLDEGELARLEGED